MMSGKRLLLSRWHKTKKPKYQYMQVTNSISKDEKHMLIDTSAKLKQARINISFPDLTKIWVQIRTQIQEAIKLGECRISFLEIVLYWAKIDGYFARLQVQPIGNFKKLLDFYPEYLKRHAHSRGSIADLKITSFKNWKEF